MQDPDGPCVTQEEIDPRKGEKEMSDVLTRDLQGMTSNVGKLARCYRFFMEVAKNVLKATHVRHLEITAVDSNRRYHQSQHVGNYAL